MTTYQSAINDLRARLDEKNIAHYWADTDLLNWLIQGCTDIARRSETLIEYNTTLNAVAGLADYNLPADCLRVHRIEFIPQSTVNPPLVYPLQLSTMYEMDQLWGSMQYLQSVYPSWAVIRGTPGNPLNRASGVLVFKVYPVPSQNGAWNLFYYAMPNPAAQLSDNLAVSAGYENLPVLYAEHVALRADRDPRWQESKALYEQDLLAMIEMTRRLHDQSRQISWAGTGTGFSGGYSSYDGTGGW